LSRWRLAASGRVGSRPGAGLGERTREPIPATAGSWHGGCKKQG
jgi:hypothetical protein